MAAAGVSLPAGRTVDGRSLLPLLQGQQQGPLHPTLFWAGQFSSRWADKSETLSEPPAWAARKGRWMLRYWSHLKRNELYDLDTDRGERHDVIAQHPEIVQELKSEYAQWFKGIQKPLAWDEAAWRELRL